jgi:hypothetical protein
MLSIRHSPDSCVDGSLPIDLAKAMGGKEICAERFLSRAETSRMAGEIRKR